MIDSTDTYVNQSGDLRIGKIHERIKALKQSRKLEERYMQFEEMLKKERMEGYDAGHKEGHKEGHEAGRGEGQAEGSMQMWELIT